MTKPRILVTAAAGKTGRPVVEHLLERGFPVRAMVRREDDRSAELAAIGAEVVLGDFLDLPSMRAALGEVQRVYFCYPPDLEGLVDATAILAVAADDAGIEAVVNMSQITARENAVSPLSRQHWLSERVLDAARTGVVHIRPTFFAEMLLLFGAESIAREGKLYLPYGRARHAPVAAADIARVTVELLADPAQHLGERYVLTGPRSMTLAEMVEVLATELGRSVDYVDLPIEQWGEVIATRDDTSKFLVDHLKAVALDHQNGVFDAQTDVVARITGEEPKALSEFVREHRALFAAGAAVANA